MTTETNAQTPEHDWACERIEVDIGVGIQVSPCGCSERHLIARAEAAESALEVANKRAESLARTVMSDQVSNDTATGKYEVYQVQFPSGEKCYFGELSTANAYARETGTVSFVSLPKREFKVVDVETKEAYQRQSGVHFDKYQTALQRITDLQSRLDAAERDARSVREAVIEECAQEAERVRGYSFSKRRIDLCREVAEAIRSLTAHPAEPAGKGSINQGELK